jgi:bis(5'-nucleosyl)-tetraphosphatase (symmetrical)
MLRDAGAEPILGNHERHLLAVVGGREDGDWKRDGSALVQLRAAGELDRAAGWIATWPLVRQGRNWIVVHAGLHPKRDPANTGADFLTEVRFCNAKGKRPKKADGKLTKPPRGFKPWYEFYDDARTVVFGHWARLGLLVRGRLRGLDTGCVYGGELTGLWWPEDRLVQVPSSLPYRRLPERKNGR